jgi:exoribonuclease R
MVMTNRSIGEIIIEKYGENCIIRTHDVPIENEEALGGLDEKTQIYIRMRNFKKAIYEIAKDKYHYALGIKNYVHFTSPIRRYNDVIIHKIVNRLIVKEANPVELCEDDVNRINDIERRIRKADRMRDKCRLIHQLEKDHLEEELILKGIVIKMKEKYLLIYFPKYDIEERLPYDKDSMKVELYDEIECRLIPFFKNQKFHNKIKIEYTFHCNIDKTQV